MKIYTADKVTGTFIEEVSSIELGKALIEQYEQTDKSEGVYQSDFYDLVDENHESIL